MRNRISKKTLASALSASLVLVLGGCGGMPSNRSLESIHQPVVARTNYTLDIVAGPAGSRSPNSAAWPAGSKRWTCAMAIGSRSTIR